MEQKKRKISVLPEALGRSILRPHYPKNRRVKISLQGRGVGMKMGLSGTLSLEKANLSARVEVANGPLNF
jgi:hypothetical protein